MLIHIGYHKTGTSWLQSVYFPNHPRVAVVGAHPDLMRAIIEPDGFAFDATVAREFFQPRIGGALSAGKVPVLTTERLSGNPHSGGYDSATIADRLHATFPEAKILIVVRRQLDMAVSMYKQYVRMGGICTLREYLFPPRDGRIPLFRAEFLEYHRLAHYYAQRFGPQQVRVMLYERLRDEPSAFLQELARFSGIDPGLDVPQTRVNESLSDFETRLRRRVNRWHGGDSLHPVTPPAPRLTAALYKAIRWLDGTPVPRLWPVDYRTEARPLLEGRFRESNRELAKEFGLDLQECGYEI